MSQWIFSSCALICMVLALRAALKNRISARLRYALWGLVLLRLLLPVSFGHSAVSVMNAVPDQAPHSVQAATDAPAPAQQPSSTLPQAAPSLQTAEDAPAGVRTSAHRMWSHLSPAQLLRLLWLAGTAVMALLLLGSSLRFAVRLRRSRQPLETSAPLPVYVSDAVETPCLLGLFRPVIYLMPRAAENATVLRHALAHETAHYRQLDHVWALLRCAALALHWYNPLVWLAAALSRQDGELACDEATLRRLGNGERAAYGNTLLDLTVAKPQTGTLLSAAVTMTSGTRCIAERIRRIARSGKPLRTAAVAVLLAAAVAVGCTFTGASAAELPPLLQPAAAEPDILFTTQDFGHLSAATLHWNGQEFPVTDPLDLDTLSDAFSNSKHILTSYDPGCPREAELEVTLRDGRTALLQLSTDHCSNWQTGNQFYQYQEYYDGFNSIYMHLAIKAAAEGRGAKTDGWYVNWGKISRIYGAPEAAKLLKTLSAWATEEGGDAQETRTRYIGVLRCANELTEALEASYGQLLLTLYERDPQCFADCCAEAHLRAMQYRSVVQLLADAAGESFEALRAMLDTLSGN